MPLVFLFFVLMIALFVRNLLVAGFGTPLRLASAIGALFGVIVMTFTSGAFGPSPEKRVPLALAGVLVLIWLVADLPLPKKWRPSSPPNARAAAPGGISRE